MEEGCAGVPAFEGTRTMEHPGFYIWLWILIGNAVAVVALLSMKFDSFARDRVGMDR
jgi:hypothetical protein